MRGLQVPGAAQMRSLLVTAGSVHREPWWWNDIDHDAHPCELEHQTVIVENGRLSRLLSLESLSLFWRVASILFAGRHRYHTVYTFECGWLSFAVAFLQTLTFYHRPRHVIDGRFGADARGPRLWPPRKFCGPRPD